MTDIAQALRSLYPDAVWTLRGFDWNGLDWHDPIYPKPSYEDVMAEVGRLSQLEQDQQTAVAQQNTNKATLEQQAATALTNNRAFLQKASYTNAEIIAQVKDLTRQNNAIIRLITKTLDGTN